MKGPYDDIIHLPRHVSTVHVPMSAMDRAAQFSPFAALTGYGEAISETARQTQTRRELDESELAVLNETLCRLQALLPQPVWAAVTWFQPDERKAGGAYLTSSGQVKKLDTHARQLLLTNGSAIPIDSITELTLEWEDSSQS